MLIIVIICGEYRCAVKCVKLEYQSVRKKQTVKQHCCSTTINGATCFSHAVVQLLQEKNHFPQKLKKRLVG